jgi:hypothetical protein
MHVERRTAMKFKTYKAAKNHLINRIEKVGIDVRDVNLDSLMNDLFVGEGVGVDFELKLRSFGESFSATVRALRIPRRGTVSDEHWEAAVRRLGAYMGIYYTAADADGLERDLVEHALFAQHMVEEAL